MEKNERIESFIKHFKISLNNATVYFKNHPFFRKSTQEFMNTIENLYADMESLTLGVTSGSLLIEGQYLDEQKLHADLAQHLHTRKIKKIILSKGLTIDELIGFLSIISIPLKDLLKSGGIKKLLKDENITHITVEQLDYSELLGMTSGAEDTDIWKYLIEGLAKEGYSAGDMKEFTENFETIINKFSEKDISGDPQLMKKIKNIVSRLKEVDPVKFKQCSKTLIKFILKEKKSLGEEEVFASAKEFFEQLDVGTLSETMWEYNFESKKLDSSALEIFSQLVTLDKQKEIASDLGTRLEKHKSMTRDPKTRQRFTELVSSFDNQFVSEVYRDTLSNFIKGIGGEGTLVFDREEIDTSYLFLLLNLLVSEDKSPLARLIVEQVTNRWEAILTSRNIEYVQHFLHTLKHNAAGALKQDMKEFYQFEIEKVFTSLEDYLLITIEELPDSDFASLLGLIEKSSLTADEYIKRILDRSIPKERAITMFFKFYPEHAELLFKTMRETVSLEDARAVVAALKYIDRPESLNLLKHLYTVVNTVVRVEVLQSMQHLSTVDGEFLINVIKTNNVFLMREALKVIKKAEGTYRVDTAKLLLNVFNFMGLQDRTLIRNIRLITEERFFDAYKLLVKFSQRFFFPWQRKVKLAAVSAANILAEMLPPETLQSERAGEEAAADTSGTESHA